MEARAACGSVGVFANQMSLGGGGNLADPFRRSLLQVVQARWPHVSLTKTNGKFERKGRRWMGKQRKVLAACFCRRAWVPGKSGAGHELAAPLGERGRVHGGDIQGTRLGGGHSNAAPSSRIAHGMVRA